MSRITGSEIVNLMEAYTSVYYPQELTEEQVWEEVETWVNSLVEEGYDLSDYTWEEMYESYLSEMGQRMTTGQATAPKVAPTPTSRPQVAGGGMGGMRGSGRDRNATQTSSSPGALRVKPSSAPYQSRFAGARDAAFSRARQIQGSPVVGSRVATPAAQAPARPATQAPARTATPPAAPKPTAATTPTPTPSAPRPKDTSITDMIGRSQVRQGAPINTGSSTSDARAIAARASVGATPKPAPSTAAAKPTPRQARLNMEMEYDTFDAILEHLVAEGYADTNENAIAIMANMSEEWREEILDEAVEIMSVTSPEGKRRKGSRIYSGKASQMRQNARKLSDLQKRQRSNPKAMGTRSARRQATDEVETNAKKSITRLNAKPDETTLRNNTSYYPTVPTDYRARRRRASGR